MKSVIITVISPPERVKATAIDNMATMRQTRVEKTSPATSKVALKPKTLTSRSAVIIGKMP